MMTTCLDEPTGSVSVATMSEPICVNNAACALGVAATPRLVKRRIFVTADWSNVEGRLTAHFSGDPVLTAELEAELHGGPKVHSLNAALIYGCAPEDAKTHMVNFKGAMRPAYEGGKRLTHAFNYGMGEIQMAETFWVARAFARDAICKLAMKYAGVVAYRHAIADEVFGVVRYRCVSCGAEAEGPVRCDTCSKGRAWPVVMKAVPMSRGTREYRTAFGRRRRYLGPKAKGEKPLASQPAQGSGASMWNTVLLALHGWDIDTHTVLPLLDGALRFSYDAPVNDLLRGAEIAVVTGTYDSFATECNEPRRDEVGEWLRTTMERPWPQLDGKTFPVELHWGYNLGKQSKENPDGLRLLCK